jgi:CubicO group peptidase (beta-lactamase class C family)
MKCYNILFSLFFGLCMTLSAQQAADNSPVGGRIAQARDLVQRDLQQNNYPGIAVAVWQTGELIWSEGFGYANIADGTPVDPSGSLFRIGSVSKTLTAAGMAKLVERGVLDLDATIQTYVPEFPEKQWPITTRQVAQHVAGIRHYNGFEFYSNVSYPSVQEALTVFMNDTLLFEPGSKYAYSSYGWNLISAVMEGASKRDFLAFMQEEIFTPGEMLNTYPDDVNLSQLPRVTFYSEMSGENIVAAQVDNSIKWAGGGFLSTAEDLVKFGEAILDDKFTKRSTTEEFWTVATLNDGQKTNYGLGWSTNRDKHDRLWVGHSGGSVGGSTMFLVYPQEKLIVVTLINRSGARAPELAFTIAEQFLHER